MTALKDMPISFPGLFPGWEFNPDPVAIHIGHGIYWYGIILALGFLAGLLLCMKQAPKYGLTEDNVLDLVLWAVPCCVLGSRIYYVIFYLDLYRNPDGGLDWLRIVSVWDGGLAIYGTIIAGAIVAFLYTRRKKIPFGALADLAVMGLLLGQIIGRWANFINREAFGGLTELPWRMRIWISAYQYADVHPTFLYESLWNLAGLLLVLFIVSKGRRFDGENTWFYFLWYGLGRAWIEGLRTDSLYLFDWTFLGEPIRVSQALSMVLAALSAVMLFYNIAIRKPSRENLLVCRTARQAQEAAEAEAEAALAAETAAAAANAAQEAPASPAPDAVETPEPENAPEFSETPALEAEEAPAPEAEDASDSAPEAEKAPGGDPPAAP